MGETSYSRNILALMRMSQSRSAKFIAHYLFDRVTEFLEYVELSRDVIMTISEGDASAAEDKTNEVFPTGWLDPNGKFVTVGIAKHEETVKKVAGHDTCDRACRAGWIKFTAGLPCDYNGECLFGEEFSDRRRLSGRQKEWLDKWLLSIAEPETTIPIFD